MAIPTLAILVLFMAGFLVFYVYLLDLIIVRRDFATTALAVKKVAEIIEAAGKQKGNFFDLGSSRGWLVFGVLKHCPALTATGVDDSNLRIWLSRFLSRLLRRRAVFLKGDVFKADISSADIVYVYLDQSVMPALQEKLQRELKPGAMVILNTQHFPSWPTFETFVLRPSKPAYEKMSVYIKD